MNSKSINILNCSIYNNINNIILLIYNTIIKLIIIIIYYTNPLYKIPVPIALVNDN